MASDTFEIGLGRARQPLVLAIDVGSTASRGALYDTTGRPVKPREKVAHSFTTASDGTSVIDPDQVLAEVTGLITELVHVAGGRPIAGVALDTFASSLVGVDTHDRAITTCFNYNDNRCAGEVDGLRAEADEDESQDRTGCRFHASYLPAKLRWIRRSHPDVWHRVSRWLSLGEYLHLRLLGQASAGTSTAAWTGLLNRRTSQWDEVALAVTGISADRLSPIADPDQPLQPLPGSVARRLWPQLADALWFAPVGDGYAATRGLGAGSESTGAVISLSTSGAMRILVHDPVGEHDLDLPRGLWCYRVDAERSLIGGAVNDVGRLTSWLQRELRLPDPATLSALLHEPPSGSTPLVLPFLTGERSTGWSGSSRATFHHVSYSNTALDIYRGALEGIVWSFQRIADQIALIDGPVTHARVGGRVSSEAPGLLSAMANGLAMELTPVTVKRSTLLGTARIALEVVAPGVPRADAETGRPLSTDPAWVDLHDRHQLLLDDLYTSVVDRNPGATGAPASDDG